MNRAFANLDALGSFIGRIAKRERKCDERARTAVASTLTSAIQNRLGKPSLLLPRLADSTRQRRVALGYPADTTLLMTGALRESISHATVGLRETDVGSSSPYAPYHEFGGSRKGRPPKRSFMASTAREGDRGLFALYTAEMRKLLGL